MAKSNIVIQTDRLTDAVIGTLASVTAVILDSTFTGLTQNFLLKKLRTHLFIEGLGAIDGVIIGYCAGDLTIAQIATIFGTPELGPAEADEGALSRKIYWESVRTVESLNPLYSLDGQSLGGGKGIPTFEGVGYQMFAFNPMGHSFAAAVQASGSQANYGVWM